MWEQKTWNKKSPIMLSLAQGLRHPGSGEAGLHATT